MNASGEQHTDVLTDREKGFIQYAEKLTLHPTFMNRMDLKPLRDVGLSDEGILDLNQLIAYFNYVNRIVNGLGVDIAGEKLGFHPNEDVDSFAHH